MLVIVMQMLVLEMSVTGHLWHSPAEDNLVKPEGHPIWFAQSI